MSGDRPYFGILLMLGFCVLAPLGDGLAKLVGNSVPLVMLLLARFGIQALILAPLGAALKLPASVPRDILALTALRTLLHIIGIGAMFLSLRFLPLADAIAIAFVMPFILLIMGHKFLGEEVGPVRLIACAVGFVGTLLVIQPNFAQVGLPALLPLLVAITFACFMLVTRTIARRCDPITLQSVSGLMAVAILLPAALLTPAWPELHFIWPERNTTLLLIGIGAIGTLAHLLMTWSLRYAPSATLAPMQYSEIPVATLIGFLMFDKWPNGLAAIGIAITMAAGLFVILRERATARAQTATP